MSDRYDELERVRLGKIEALRERGVDPYPVRFDRTATAAEVHAAHGDLDAGAETGQTVSVAGRVMLSRDSGKLAFVVLRDGTGEIQLFCSKAVLGDEAFADVKSLDLGDWVGATGEVIKTKRGEVSVKAERVQLLSKAITPLPEKWHGLKDLEKRVRQRYVDLIVNDDARRVATVRTQTVAAIRSFMAGRDFIEVETPMLQNQPGGANAKPFATHLDALDIDVYLRIAPELYLKRLIVGGMERVFEVNRNFRNEGVSTKYNPEFTMLEAYQAFGDYHDMMSLMEDMVSTVAERVLGTTAHTYQGKSMPLAAPFKRGRLIDLASHAVHTELDLDMDAAKVREIADDAGVDVEESWSTHKTVLEIYEKLVEPNLFEPIFVMDFPREVSPLARPHRDDPRFTEHFDLVMAGMEIGPAYSELNDPIDQRERFEAQAREKAAGDVEAMTVDEDFLRALSYGMPPTGGLGFGIDRFTMILADAASIREVILFPFLRPEA